MKYYGLITIKDVEYSCHNEPRWRSSYNEDNDYSYEDYGYPSPDYYELKETSYEVIVKTFLVLKLDGGSFNTVEECENALYKQINLLEETEEFAKYFFEGDILSSGVTRLFSEELEVVYDDGITNEVCHKDVDMSDCPWW